MKQLPKKELILHSIMCIIGGFVGAYALLCRAENFGNAQTSNLMHIIFCITGKNYVDFLLRVLGIALYISAILLYVFLDRRTCLDLRKYAVLVDTTGLFILFFIPPGINPILGILPIFFMMATQWSVFHGVGEYNSSTIFSTNNVRQMALSFGSYLLDKESSQLARAKFFANSLLWYHIGVLISVFACPAFGTHASLCALPLTLCALGLTCYQNIEHLLKRRMA